jgi:hypothetical protein
MNSQTDAILAHLRAGNSLTQLEALSLFGCMRLPSRIDELHKRGVGVVKDMVKLPTGKRVAKYYLP